MGDRSIPGINRLYEISRELKQIIFRQPINHKAMVQLLDIIGNDPRAPNPHKIPYGQAIDGICNARELMRDVGVGGTNLQNQSKQAITCCLMSLMRI